MNARSSSAGACSGVSANWPASRRVAARTSR
jgi:hypothetical protein